jgi:hypothetical protein
VFSDLDMLSVLQTSVAPAFGRAGANDYGNYGVCHHSQGSIFLRVDGKQGKAIEGEFHIFLPFISQENLFDCFKNTTHQASNQASKD